MDAYDQAPFATAEMDANRTIVVRYDADPERAIAFEPGDPAYARQIEFAKGLKPGESKRQSGREGRYLNGANGLNFHLNKDGSYETSGIICAGEICEVAYRTITPQEPDYPCLSRIVEGSRKSVVGQSYPFFNFLSERIDACVKASLGSPEKPK